MRDYIEAFYDPADLKNYIIEILQAEETGFFLPVSFIKEENMTRCIYKVKRYYPLRLFKEFSIDDVFKLVLSFIRGIRESETSYIFPEDYDINFNFVYADENMEQVKVCYIPSSGAPGAEGKILEFLYFFESRVGEDDEGYLLQLEKFLGNESSDYRSFEAYVCRIRREKGENSFR